MPLGLNPAGRGDARLLLNNVYLLLQNRVKNDSVAPASCNRLNQLLASCVCCRNWEHKSCLLFEMSSVILFARCCKRELAVNLFAAKMRDQGNTRNRKESVSDKQKINQEKKRTRKDTFYNL